MKKVCFLTNNINQLGGIERLISLLSDGFSQNDEIDLTILSLYSKPCSVCYFDISEKTKCIHAGLALSQQINDYLIHYFNNNRYDDLVTFHAGIALTVSHIIDKIKPINWIATEHNYPTSYSWKRRLINLFAYRKADYLVVLTDEAEKYYRRKLIRNIKIIPNPVSFISDRPSCYQHNILAVGRIEKVKRFDLLVNAYIRIEKKYPGWKLLIVGGGTQLNKLKHEAKLYDSIEFLGSRKDIKELMLNSSFLVISSEYEGFSLVALEAMECGLPIVSTQLPSIHFISRGFNAVLFANSNDPDDLAEKMEQFMSNPSLIHEMGLEAKKCAKKYHLNQIMDLWTAIL